jgi:hypothetical protein
MGMNRNRRTSPGIEELVAKAKSKTGTSIISSILKRVFL